MPKNSLRTTMVIKMKTNELRRMTDDQDWCSESKYHSIRNPESEKQISKWINSDFIEKNKAQIQFYCQQQQLSALFNVSTQLKPYFVPYFPLSSFVCWMGIFIIILLNWECNCNMNQIVFQIVFDHFYQSQQHFQLKNRPESPKTTLNAEPSWNTWQQHQQQNETYCSFS